MKLKKIPQNTVVHTPTEAEAKELLDILHENGYEWYHKYAPAPNPNLSKAKYINIYNSLNGCSKVITYCDEKNFVDRFLTLAEFKERYCEVEKPQAKFKVGDKVRIIQDDSVNPAYVGIVDEIASIGYRFQLKNTDSNWSSEALEPYTEPETKPTEEMESNKESNKELNLCELLKGHEGETIFLTTIGNVILESVSEINIRFKFHETAKDSYLLKATGKMNENGEVIAYPSRALYEQYPLDPYTAWMVWKEEQKKYLLEVKLHTYDTSNFQEDLYFRTPADRDKALAEITAIIEKYSKR